MNLNFKNKTVLVTGGTRGIGKAVTNVFYESGADIIVTGTNSDQIKKMNDEKTSERILYAQADFSSRESLANFNVFLGGLSKIDVLINNAGINIIDDFVETKSEDFDKIYNVNLFAPYEISKIAAAKMIKNRYGRIVNIASIWSKITRPKRALYTSTKNALHGLTETMAVELSMHNILVNSVSPGFTLTELTETTNTPAELVEISNKIPIKRMAQPVEIANVVVFLASDKNSYLTGQNIVVDGGYVIV